MVSASVSMTGIPRRSAWLPRLRAAEFALHHCRLRIREPGSPWRGDESVTHAIGIDVFAGQDAPVVHGGDDRRQRPGHVGLPELAACLDETVDRTGAVDEVAADPALVIDRERDRAG